ncbi:Gamma-glutamyltransferase [Handroanthus impetiginosus]|uniref:Gamma-glutamyltransferase n=1 Tax=Handroanthus impetiginosus TaxID=429701 RepID=A0A2G9GKD9_9LAMI|nr:Gamma-glutamyltransferase [Handroanthus impetiginosus]
MLARQANGEANVFDLKETAPKRAFITMYNKHKIDQIRGKLSIAVPGQLAGLHEAWKKYGKLPWNNLVSPSENLAPNGFKISKYLNRVMEYEILTLKRDPMLRSIFTVNGKPLKPGQTLIQKTLADTLAEIAKGGIMAFYNGSIGQRLVNDAMGSAGILSMDDLQSYRVKIRKPLTADVMGLQIVSAPPPSFDSACFSICSSMTNYDVIFHSYFAIRLLLMLFLSPMQVLKFLEQYGFLSGVSKALDVHRMIEALKYALSMRMELGDPDFINLSKTLTSMLSTNTAKKLRDKINDAITYPSHHYFSKQKQIEDHGTTHVCVVNKDRNTVSMMISLNSIFGSGYMFLSTGILLNNHMLDFSIPVPTEPPPAPSNFISPRKRPLSSTVPTVILEGGQLKVAIGGAGGVLIPEAILEVILNHFMRKMDPLSSVTAPRYYHKLHPNVVQYENYSWMGAKYRAPLKTIKFLKSRNHNIVGDPASLSSCVFAVQETKGSDSGKIFAVTDARMDGSPAGYSIHKCFS